ncbi:MAG: hypothetical protein HY926_12880 [Elusimicrobia bacterium]|nr:hypothetical protein [Elusimicrobiota bacterium]
MRNAGWLLAALLAAGPARAIEPTSNTRVVVSTAAVTGLECRRRPFRMEWTRDIGLRYRKAAAESFSRDPDLRTVTFGLAAMILMAPLAVLAAPADLVAAPWRRVCEFDVYLEGGLAGWAGSGVGGERLSLQGRSLVEPGVPEYLAPRYLVSGSTATADDAGRFALSLPGRVGRNPVLELGWLVDGRPSGVMTLRKSGGRFVLSEPEPEFGAGEQTMAPLEINPRRSGAPRPARNGSPD